MAWAWSSTATFSLFGAAIDCCHEHVFCIFFFFFWVYFWFVALFIYFFSASWDFFYSFGKINFCIKRISCCPGYLITSNRKVYPQQAWKFRYIPGIYLILLLFYYYNTVATSMKSAPQTIGCSLYKSIHTWKRQSQHYFGHFIFACLYVRIAVLISSYFGYIAVLNLKPNVLIPQNSTCDILKTSCHLFLKHSNGFKKEIEEKEVLSPVGVPLQSHASIYFRLIYFSFPSNTFHSIKYWSLLFTVCTTVCMQKWTGIYGCSCVCFVVRSIFSLIKRGISYTKMTLSNFIKKIIIQETTP